MAIQVRRGNYADLDPDSLLPGEWAVSVDQKYVHMCFAPGDVRRMATYEGFEADMEEVMQAVTDAQASATAAATSESNVTDSATSASTSASNAATSASEASASATSASESASTATTKATTATSKATVATNKANEAATSATNAATSESNASASATSASESASTATTKASEASASATSASSSASTATTKASEASTSATNASTSASASSASATESESWAVGGTGTRTGEDTNNAHYWAQQAQNAVQGVTDYDQLTSRPQIGGTTLTGNKTLSDLGIEPQGALTNAKAYTDTEVAKKVDKVTGKDLSTNDYTTVEKTKLSGIATGANKTTVDMTFNSVSNNPATSSAIAVWVASQIANGSLHKVIVTALPTTNIDTDAIYMILKETASENDIYNEYLNMDGTTSGWEFIGSSAVDLTNVYTKTEANNVFAFKADTGNKADLTTTEKETIVGAVNEVNGNLGGLVFAQNEDGKWGYKVGADPVVPFSNIDNLFVNSGITGLSQFIFSFGGFPSLSTNSSFGGFDTQTLNVTLPVGRYRFIYASASSRGGNNPVFSYNGNPLFPAMQSDTWLISDVIECTTGTLPIAVARTATCAVFMFSVISA